MPNKKTHLDIIGDNYRAVSHLSAPDPTDFNEWRVAIIYYMSLHYIQAYLANKFNDHPTSHQNLQQIFRQKKQLKSIYSKYRNLEDEARQARYDGNKLTNYQMRSSFLKDFVGIQDKICSLLNIPSDNKLDLYPLFPLN